jgi:hypothetical protein
LKGIKKNEALDKAGDNGLKYGLYTFSDGIESKFYWGIRNSAVKRIKFT